MSVFLRLYDHLSFCIYHL